MCEILIRAVDGIGNYEIEGPGRGHIVTIQPDGHIWGKLECPPEYFIVKIPGLNPASIRRYCSVYYDLTQPEKPIMIYRRRWVIREQLMSTIQSAGGIVTVTQANFNVALIDRTA